MTSNAVGQGPGRGSGRPKDRPHIDDILFVDVDLDVHAPLESVLQRGEQYFKQAESAREFGRPDLALGEYMKASIVVGDIIPKNKGYASMSGNHKAQMNRYKALSRAVDAKHDVYEKIKTDIKADNARTGVKPTVQRRVAPEPESGDRLSLANGQTSNVMQQSVVGPANGAHQEDITGANGVPGQPHATSEAKSKPAIHPKPAALHGNAIKSKPGSSTAPESNAAKDLEARFAKIRTSKPATPAPEIDDLAEAAPPSQLKRSSEVPPSHRPGLSLGGGLTKLPKPPAAIYSPARATLPSTAADPSSSSGRVPFSRSGSAASSLSYSNAAPLSPTPDDYFGSAGPPTPPSSKQSVERKRPNIPEGQTISVEELVHFMQVGSKAISILLIDVRGREDFKEGHIMAQDCICIEASTLQRENSSADEIYDSLILSESWEQELFGRRHEFDLVVFYDDDSSQLAFRRDNPRNRALTNLFNALVHFDTAPRDPNTLKLLRGGISAWTATMGERNLTSSSVRAGVANGQRRPKYRTRKIGSQAEADQWEALIHSSPPFVRDKEEFLRRKPGAPSAQESMTAPVTPDHGGYNAYAATSPRYVEQSLPQPPSRPAPAVPRPTYSGFAEPDDHAGQSRAMMARPGSSSRPERRAHTVGLDNPRVWCYANASLQALFGTCGFSEGLSRGEWAKEYKVGRKADEKIAPPQLLTKILANLFYWMQTGKFPKMRAKTLMDYIYHIHARNKDGEITKSADITLGGPDNQQDAQDFLNFLFEQLDDETNIFRDGRGAVEQPQMGGGGRPIKTLAQGALEYWEAHSRLHASLVDRYWRGLEAFETTCQTCRTPSVRYQAFEFLNLHLPPRARAGFRLEDLLDVYSATEEMAGEDAYQCDHCNAKRTAKRRNRLARLPDRLAIIVVRFEDTSRKRTDLVSFPIRGLDLTPYSIGDGTGARQFRGPFAYDCYAVVQHRGSSIQSGHYIAYVKDDSADVSEWHQFNDTRITPKKIMKEGDAGELFGDESGQAYLLFYQRRDSEGT